MKLFRKKNTAEHTDIVFEKWHTSFSIFQDHRFVPESDLRYSSAIEHGALILRLRQKNLFAWTDDPLYRYDNFNLRAAVSIDKSNGYSSAGVMFRRTDNLSYYYFLISSKGYYRLDLVLNGTPSVLIDWTVCPEFNSEKFTAGVTADGGSICLFIDGNWIGEIYDESLSAGGISFAGQNYDEQAEAVFRLESIEMESRPAQLEKIIEKQSGHRISFEARYDFAQSLVVSGHYSAALVELNKILKEDERHEALMLAAECCINLEQFDRAGMILERVPAADRNTAYTVRKAGLYYLTNRFIELRDLLNKELTEGDMTPVLYNLLGNAEYALGNWAASAEAYHKAFQADGAAALFALNAARALEKAGDDEAAASMYSRAAALYFRQNQYDELSGVLPFLERLDSSRGIVSAETRLLKAKMMFHDEEFDSAYAIFEELIAEDRADSTVYYLKALIDARNSRSRKALAGFKKAVELEPSYYLYHFKLSEFLFLTGGKYEESLQAALESAPEDPWVLNLAGLAAERTEDYAGAAELFRKAFETVPEEDEIRVNYSEALFNNGRTEEALKLLDDESAVLLNQRGNIFSKLKRFDDAVSAYEAASRLDRRNPDIILNLAAACIETDSFSRAEELLVQILEEQENPAAYNLMGNLALLMGEYNRAEAAYQKAAALDPLYTEAVCNLAELYIRRERLTDADMLLSAFRGQAPGARFEGLKETVFRKRMNIFECGSCGREWVVPRKMAEQPALKLKGEPPDEMPAGKCSGCGKVYCIECAKENLDGGRFICTACGLPLKLSEDWMRYLYHQKGF